MIEHVGRTFGEWLRERDSTGSHKYLAAIRQIIHFLETQGDHRFTPIGTDNFNHVARKDRAGYIVLGQPCWLVFSGVYTDEMLRGHSARAVSKHLIARGALIPGADGRAAQSKKIKGQQHRVYVLTPKVMELAP